MKIQIDTINALIGKSVNEPQEVQEVSILDDRGEVAYIIKQNDDATLSIRARDSLINGDNRTGELIVIPIVSNVIELDIKNYVPR